ncbi:MULTISPECIES: DMT family transporter [Gammaproteobacteria]|uniref:DMT family transporter n=1 Tax=Gammaproteobacteria TaxID=1236 RepID=UPI0010136F81|nr:MULTISPECIES: multidrug efflux SMR transporter [Gammaproteobacteria]
MAIRLTLQPWLFLLAAVASEVVGVTTMKLVAQEHDWGALLFMYSTIGLSFAFLAMAMKQIPMAAAYATWETLGLLAIAFIGYRYFGESMSAGKLLGMSVLIVGVVLVNADGAHARERTCRTPT